MVTVGSSLGNFMLLLVDRFEVEPHALCDFDYLLVNGIRYCGHSGPQSAVVQAGSTVEWHSDPYTTAAGWRICGSTLPPREPPGPPTPPALPPAPPAAPQLDAFVVSSGSCVVSSNCLQHAAYPAPYGFGECAEAIRIRHRSPAAQVRRS
eukprot:2627942-Prymnesium_polylepis.1